ncbi:MAG: hypothetical protein KDI04_06850, partial [Halieaceae bacterium]|nr:hypothetical protein [Halieaceae bacterium]
MQSHLLYLTLFNHYLDYGLAALTTGHAIDGENDRWVAQIKLDISRTIIDILRIDWLREVIDVPDSQRSDSGLPTVGVATGAQPGGTDRGR